jgi:toxin HigB-1
MGMSCYKNEMGIDFATDMLRAIETDAAGSTKLPVSVIQAARRKLALLRAACDERSLKNWRSLDCEALPVATKPEGIIRLTEHYRMAFKLHFDVHPQTITITDIEKCH